MPKPLPALIACPHCDALYRRPALGRGERARCARCNAPLYREAIRLNPDHLLALVVAASITLVIANAFPVVQLSTSGITHSASLIGSIGILWEEGRVLTAMLAFATTIAFPVAELGAFVALLVIIRREPGSPHVAALLRGIQMVRPWGMTEVFMLGIVVALVKISHTAQVVPGVALFAFAALTILLTLIVSYDLKALWALRPLPRADS